MNTALTLAMPMLPAQGGAASLDDYIQAVNRIPLLSAEEETTLAEQLQQHNDLGAARRLVLSHLRLVTAIARNYSGYGLPQADLIQEGNIGLMKAVKRFDASRGVRLVSFAVHWIKAEIHEYILKNWRLVKIATTKAQRKLFFNLRSLKQHEGSLTPREVQAMAEQLGVRPEDVHEMETRFAGQDIALEPLEGDEDSFAPIAYLTDANSEPSVQLARRAHDALQGEGLQQALASLDARSRHIVQARWLNDEDEEPATLQTLAAEYGVSAERIRQIEQKALQKMRQSLSAWC